MHSSGKSRGSKSWFPFKIDLEKAYNKLEWDFIRAALISFNFDEASISLIMSAICSNRTSILINGKPSEAFSPSRGIRQGDPLSPYIFILCMEWLSRLIHHECQVGAWIPFRLGRRGFEVSHLMFADDLILFGEANERTLLSMQDIHTGSLLWGIKIDH